MKRFLTVAMLTLFSAAVSAEVKIDINEFTGGKIVASQGEPAEDGSVVVTLTVTPDEGYYIRKEDIKVVLTRSTEESTTRDGDPHLAGDVTLEGSDPENLSDSRIYTFTIAEGLGAWVREANFHVVEEQPQPQDPTDISAEGSELKWEFSAETGALVITGSGSSKDLGGEGSDPLAEVRSQIQSVVIGEGVTGLGANLLAGCDNLSYIKIENASKVLSLGEGAIPANDGLQIRVPFNLQNEYWITSGWGDFKYDSADATPMDITFSAQNQYDTFAAGDEALVVPSVLSAYIITGIDGNGLNLSKVNVITPGMAVVIFNERELKDTKFVTATTSAEPSRSANLLHVASEKMEVKLGEVFLFYNDVFYYSQAGTIPQGGIYLENASPAKTRSFYSLNGDGTTAINPLYINKVETQSSWYTLDGRQLPTAPTKKGLYIKNGKKIIIR